MTRSAALNISGQLAQVNKAFSNQSVIYDAKEERNAIQRWMRARVRRHVLSVLKPGSHILELNAGTGLDAIYFAEHGHSVHATDLSEGMVQKIKEKIAASKGSSCVTAEQRSLTDLVGVPEHSFDCIFSNFDGLNCVPDPGAVISQFRSLLKPGGMVILVVLPPVCPWEMASALKGHFSQAFRRLKKKGAYTHLEGEYFTTWYFTPKELIKAFGKDYILEGLEGLGSLVPPPYRVSFPERRPKLFQQLCRWEERMAKRWPFNRWADHFILTMRMR